MPRDAVSIPIDLWLMIEYDINEKRKGSGYVVALPNLIALVLNA